MQTINYKVHLILHSKYKFIINFLILLFMYSFFYNKQPGLCMTGEYMVSRESKVEIVQNIEDLFSEESPSNLSPSKQDNDTVTESKLKFSEEDEKRLSDLASDLKLNSTKYSLWNNVRNYFGYERIDTATIDNPLDKAEFLKKYQNFVKKVQADQASIQTNYENLENMHNEKIKNLTSLEENYKSQKEEIKSYREQNDTLIKSVSDISQIMLTKLTNIEVLINQNAAISGNQLNCIKRDLDEVLIYVGETQTSYAKLNETQLDIFNSMANGVNINENLVDQIRKAEMNSKNIQEALQDNSRKRAESLSSLNQSVTKLIRRPRGMGSTAPSRFG